MIVVVDAGNTNVKWYVFENGIILRSVRSTYDDFFSSSVGFGNETFEKAVICNVSAYDTAEIMAKFPVATYYEFTHSSKIPMKIAYATSETLGLDRIAAAIGANLLSPDRHKLVIDFGTAITVDFVEKNNTFIGGNISLGLHARFKALHEYTGKLPLIETVDSVGEIGKTTHEAVVNGVVLGIKYEIEEYIRFYEAKYQDVAIFFTGGDCHFFEKNIKNTIFAHQNLVALGLYVILKYNEA